MAQYDGSIRINTNIDTRGLRQGEGEIRSSLERMSSVMKKFAGVIATTFAVGKLVQFGKAALQTASDFEAMEAQFSQVFGNLEADASKSLSGIAKQAGIAEERMKSSYTKIAAFAKTTGMDTASSMELANRAMVVVADSAAFYDRSLEETTESLQSFLKGNYENDAALGLSATEFTRNAAANRMYGKSFQDLSEAQKQLTLLQMVEDANQLSGAMGQAAREADTWTNQIGNLKQAWSNLMASIGKIVLPVAIQAVKFITNVINSLTAMISKLSAAAGAFRSFSELLTGKKASGGNGAGNVASSGGMSETADGYNAAADAAENLASSTEKAAKATKDAQKAAEGYLSPLDEINKISKESDVSTPDTGGAGGIGGGVGGAIDAVDYGNLAEGETVVDKLDKKLLELKEILAGLVKPFKDAWESEGAATIEAARFAFSSLGELIKSVAKSFYEVWTNGTGTQTLELILQIAQNVLTTIGNIAQRLNEAWNTNDVGTSIIQNIFNIYNTILSTIERITGATAEWSAQLDFTPLLTSINGLLESIQPLTENIGDGLAWFYENVLLPIAGWTIQEAVPAFLDMLSAAIGVVNEVIEALKPLGVWLWEEFLQPLGQWAGDVIIGAMQTITDLLTKFGDWISDHQETVQNFTIVIGSFAAAWGLVSAAVTIWSTVSAIATGATTAFGAAVAFLTSPIAIAVAIIGSLIAIGVLLYKNWDTIKEKAGELKDWLVKKWEEIKQKTSDIWDAVKKKIGDVWNAIKTTVSNAINAVKTTVSNIWNAIKTTTSTIWNAIKSNVSTVWNSIKSIASSVFNAIKSTVSTIWNALKSLSSSVWNGIKSALSSVWNGIKSVASSAFGGIKNAIVSAWNFVKTSTSNIWNGIANAVKAPINAIIGFINRMISGIASGVNSISNMVNSIGFDIPDWLGGGSWHPNLPTWTPGRIPYLATGTVVPPNREFMAVLGDNKREPEIVSPLSTMKQANRESLLEVLSELGLMGGGISKGNTYNIKALAHSKVLFELMIEEGKIQQMSTGRNPFMLGTT